MTTYPETMPQWARTLDLQAHPEGGWYRRTYRSGLDIAHAALPPGYPGDRPSATAILFLLLPGEESAWHRVRSDELWIHQRGGRLELCLGATGGCEPGEVEQRLVLGGDLRGDESCSLGSFQALAPADVWQCARPLDDEPVLVSCVVTPGFDFEDFTLWPGPGG